MLHLAGITQTRLEASAEHLFLSFDKFKNAGAKALATLKDGLVGTLKTKTGTYRIVTEQDFQALVGAFERSRQLQNNLEMVIQVAHTYVEHQDASSLRSLEKVVITVSQSPGVNVQVGHGELPYDEGEPAEDEGYSFDPALLQAQAMGR